MENVLIVDDDGDLRAIVRDVLKEDGFRVSEAQDGLEAIKSFRKEAPDCVLLDLNMPYMNGIETMKELKKMNGNVPVIMLTAFGDVPTAVEAIKAGAYDFTIKPPEFDRLIITIRRAIERRMLVLEVEKVSTALESSLENLLGKSQSMKRVITQIMQVARTDFSVIVQGETGTGKSVVAGTLHTMSKRAGKPFVSVDIGLIPDHLVESELFGYKKGAFTGAERDKAGYFETAHRGTIFIDELENMSSHVQSKMLSVIEKKKVYPLGGTTPIEIDMRIIAATNKDIRESVRKKEFREDLFYRIGEFLVTLPPLRERIEDIPYFARKFIFDACTELNKQIKDISGDAVTLLMTYTWPGNLRELKNIMRKAVLLSASDVIDGNCIEGLIKDQNIGACASHPMPLRDAVRELEKKLILEALERAGGNKTKTAELLDMSYTNLLAKIKEYELKVANHKPAT